VVNLARTIFQEVIVDLVALAALHAAATAIKEAEGIVECTCENDHNSGEIIFTTVVGNQFILRLEEFEEE
jgi:hypothetical protein